MLIFVMIRDSTFYCVLALILCLNVGAQDFPELTSLDNRDILFQQISDDIQTFYRSQAGNALAPQLSIYQYRIKEGDNLFSLAARLNLPQSSITTINRLDNPILPDPGTILLIPNSPGMFIPEDPVSSLEKMLSQRVLADKTIELSERFIIPSSETAWRFVAAGDFTGVERRAFLRVFFHDPLPGAYISSIYGLRESPFTGKMQFHFGIDLVAPTGTVVRSTAEGTIVDTGKDPVYGQYIRIRHPGGYESLYAHLDKTYITPNTGIRAGERIAEVGSSGLSTGAHLHFEILYLGENQNPQSYIRR